MGDFISLNEQFRMWLRAKLEETIGDNPEKMGFVGLTAKALPQICIEEVYGYLVQKKWKGAQTRTSDILEIERRTVLRAIEKKLK